MIQIQAFPSISDEEFGEACQTLERRCHDKLNGTDWSSVRFNAKEGELRIFRKGNVTSTNLAETRSLNNEMDMEEIVDSEQPDFEIEDDDLEVLRGSFPTSETRPDVSFSIVLSPTYRVPVLWFWLPSSPIVSSKDLEHVYARVVAPTSYHALKGIGVMGGVSIDNHPLTDRPCFFVHPCNTHEALKSVQVPGTGIDALQYLMLWLGVVGSAVGLHLPSQVIR